MCPIHNKVSLKIPFKLLQSGRYLYQLQLMIKFLVLPYQVPRASQSCRAEHPGAVLQGCRQKDILLVPFGACPGHQQPLRMFPWWRGMQVDVMSGGQRGVLPGEMGSSLARRPVSAGQEQRDSALGHPLRLRAMAS